MGSCFDCLLFWRKEQLHDTRKVYLNQPLLNVGHVSNRITNTKYTLLNFIPKNLWEQFGRFMNLYFLLIAALQLKPDITPVNPAATWLPLLVIFSITALKEGVDDFKRYTRDKAVNRRIVQVLRDGQFIGIESRRVMIGDIIHVQCDEEIPCDLVVLSTSEKDGSCFIQTSNLDGETDLKSRQAVPETRGMLDGPTLSQFMGTIECAHPNPEIYRFDSRMKLDSLEEYYSVSLSEKQLLLQATYLRNTDHIVGVAVYTGNETKICMNRTQPPIKWTRVDRLINRLTLFIFAFQFTLVAVFGIAGSMWSKNKGNQHDYLMLHQYAGVAEQWIYPTLRYLLLCSLMIPISLKVTLDIIKYLYAKFIDWDECMYDPVSNTYAVAASTSISEDLGQIEYVFSDKTGTLTENIMSLKKCSVKGNIYGGNHDSALQLDEALRSRISENDQHCVDLFRILSLCHTVVVARGTDKTDHGHFKASSPDEEALVKAATDMNVEFVNSDSNTIEISVNGKTEVYDKLYVLDFTSDRKRMSVIVRDRSNNRLRLLCKGADEVILPRLYRRDGQEVVQLQLESFAKEGLRTLCIAEREITPEIMEKWIAIYNQAATSIDARTQKLSEVFESIERELTLVGITAIEDKLQEDVPDTIADLRKANIRVWMLTGDKWSTAIQIATSCNLISSEGNLITIRGETEMEAVQSLGEAFLKAETMESEGGEISVIIEGKTLAYLSEYPKFCQIGLIAHTVICCRMTPQQKAQVVAMIKAKDKRTLSIGDGGNDVSMIYEAHIGVGITGREGMQAARAADYSISKFHHLRRLVLLHGRWSYNRTSFVAQYCFYKSMFICFIQLVFGFFNGYSAMTFFSTFYLTAHNILFTGIPIVFYVLDRDLPANVILSRPSLYREVQSGSKFSAVTFLKWVIRALYQSIVCWAICAQIFNSVNRNGPGDSGLDMLSMAVYTSLIIVNTLTIIFESNTLTFPNHVILWGTLFIYFISISVLGYVDYNGNALYFVFQDLSSDPRFYLSVLLSATIALLPPEIVKMWTSVNLKRPTAPHKSGCPSTTLANSMRDIETERSPLLHRA